MQEKTIDTIKKEKLKKVKNVKYARINHKVEKRINTVLSHDENASNIYKAISTGKNTFIKGIRKEDNFFDTTWVTLIEDTLPHLEKIIEHPRISMKTVYDVVPIELSKRISSESVQHLSSHAQFVKSVDKDGNVIPEKILNIGADDEYIIYENRMVCTLVRMLLLFLTKRYEYILEYSPLVDFETLYVKNESVINGLKVEIETKVKVQRDSTTRDDINLKDYANRVKYMKDLVSTFNATPFMKMFTKVRNIRMPILQTNIIRKNPDYRSCAKLLSFINGYNTLGINFVIHEGFEDLNEDEIKYLNELNMLNFLSLEAQESPLSLVKENTKVYKPKFITNNDDELFYFDHFGLNPEYVRVDKAYLDAKDKQIENVVTHPSKQEKEVYKEDYEKKRKLEAERKRILDLKKRKEAKLQEMKKMEAKQDKIEEEKKKKEEQRLKTIELEKEEKALKAAREAIINEAKDKK